MISADAVAGWSAASTRRSLQKGEPLVLDPSAEGAFVSAGCLRVYFTEEDGSQRTMSFAPDGWWVPRFDGCDAAASAAVAIDALEPTEVWLMARGHDAQSHGHMRIWSALDEWALAAMQRRVLGAMRKTAADRYAEFHLAYPGLDGRIPQSPRRRIPRHLARVPQQDALAPAARPRAPFLNCINDGAPVGGYRSALSPARAG